MIRISVIIPVYNLENYISKCIESCINQTFSDIEIICVNDGSKDRSLSILKQYESEDSRIRVIDTPNQGVVLARRTGFEKSCGDYITYVDGDDYLPLNALEKLYEKAVETGADIVNGTIVCVGWADKKDIVRGNSVQNREDFIRSALRNQDFYLPARLFKRELFEQRPFLCPPEITHNEDVIVLLSLAFVANTVASCTVESYYYVFRPSSVSGSVSDQQYIHILSARKMTLDIFRNAGLEEKYRSKLLFFMMIVVFNIVRYGNATKILSPSDIHFLSLKNLFYGNVRQILKQHQSGKEHILMYPACAFPRLFLGTTYCLRQTSTFFRKSFGKKIVFLLNACLSEFGIFNLEIQFFSPFAGIY